MNKDQYDKSKKQIKKDIPEIKKHLNLVDLQEPNFSTTDYLYNIDLYGIDEYGTAYLIQHKAMNTNDFCFEVDYSAASKKYELHAGKATHFAISKQSRLYIFDVMIMNQAIKNNQDYIPSEKDNPCKKNPFKNKEGKPIVWIPERDFLKAYIHEFFTRCNLHGFGWYDLEKIKEFLEIETDSEKRNTLKRLFLEPILDFINYKNQIEGKG